MIPALVLYVREAASAWALILADLAQGLDLELAARKQENTFGPETARALEIAYSKLIRH